MGGVGVRAIRGVRVGDCVHTHSSYVTSNPLGFWVGTGGGGWGYSSYVTSNPLGFWAGTGGWGQGGGGN